MKLRRRRCLRRPAGRIATEQSSSSSLPVPRPTTCNLGRRRRTKATVEPLNRCAVRQQKCPPWKREVPSLSSERRSSSEEHDVPHADAIAERCSGSGRAASLGRWGLWRQHVRPNAESIHPRLPSWHGYRDPRVLAGRHVLASGGSSRWRVQACTRGERQRREKFHRQCFACCTHATPSVAPCFLLLCSFLILVDPSTQTLEMTAAGVIFTYSMIAHPEYGIFDCHARKSSCLWCFLR